jgi:hypothetical protein
MIKVMYIIHTGPGQCLNKNMHITLWSYFHKCAGSVFSLSTVNYPLKICSYTPGTVFGSQFAGRDQNFDHMLTMHKDMVHYQ